jgi:hypothetical protein
VQRVRAQHGDAHDLTPDLEGISAYEELIRLAVRQDPSLKVLAEQHLKASSKPRQGIPAAQPPPAPKQAKAPWLRCATIGCFFDFLLSFLRFVGGGFQE